MCAALLRPENRSFVVDVSDVVCSLFIAGVVWSFVCVSKWSLSFVVNVFVRAFVVDVVRWNGVA